jgi:hypothetical protein
MPPGEVVYCATASISVVFDAPVVGLDLGFEQKPGLNSEVTLAVQRQRVARRAAAMRCGHPERLVQYRYLLL